jgi:hypothetical protein
VERWTHHAVCSNRNEMPVLALGRGESLLNTFDGNGHIGRGICVVSVILYLFPKHGHIVLCLRFLLSAEYEHDFFELGAAGLCWQWSQCGRLSVPIVL